MWLAWLACGIEGQFRNEPVPLESNGGGGDACADRDEDGVCNADDNCPDAANGAQSDDDGDDIGDTCDNCADRANADQSDVDEDGKGDLCEPTEFVLWVDRAEVVPVKGNEQPWDWDGNVPDWLLTASSVIAEFTVNPKVDAFADVLAFTDEVAPILLEGTVPPDAELWPVLYGAGGDIVLEYEPSGDDPDTVTPAWFYGIGADPRPGELLCVEVYDADIIDDDYIGGVCFDRDVLQWLESLGPLLVTRADADMGQIYSLSIEVEPM